MKKTNNGKDRSFVGRLVGFFSSLKLTIFLLILLAVTSIAGTVIQQQAPPQDYIKEYGESGYRIIKALMLNDMYHSWWFLALLGLLIINIVVCSLDKLPRSWRFLTHPDKWPDKSRLNQYAQKAKWKSPLEVSAASTAVKEVFREHGISYEEKEDGGSFRLFAQKGQVNRIGVTVTHLSVITIVLGGIIGGIWGFQGNMTIIEGHSSSNVILRDMQHRVVLPFSVRCDSFEVNYYPGTGMPKEYKSVLSIVEGNRTVLTKAIRVNHPLVYKGIRFYQASYGTISNERGVLTLAVTPKSGGKPKEVSVSVGGEAKIDNNTTLKLVGFYPDLVLGENNQPMSRSDELRNPAALLEIRRNGEFLGRSWVFAFHPNIHSNPDIPYNFRYVRFKGLQYTGLQISRDPGVGIVWTGCILMILGLIITFFISHRRWWVLIEPLKERSEIIVAGSTNRNRVAFESSFDELVTALKERTTKGER